MEDWKGGEEGRAEEEGMGSAFSIVVPLGGSRVAISGRNNMLQFAAAAEAASLNMVTRLVALEEVEFSCATAIFVVEVEVGAGGGGWVVVGGRTEDEDDDGGWMVEEDLKRSANRSTTSSLLVDQRARAAALRSASDIPCMSMV